MTDSDSRPYVWMLCGSLSFTVMAELAHVLTLPGACDWQAVAVARGLLAAAFAGLLARLAGAKLVFLRPWRLWVRSLAGSCSMVCTFYAFAKLPASDVLTLTNTFPLWVAVLCWPLYGQVPDRKVWLAVAAGVLGVALIEQPHLEAGNLGALAALAAAGFTSVAMLGLHSLRGIDPRAVVVHFSLVATAVCSAAFLLTERSADPARLADATVLWKLLALGLSATVGQVFLTLAFGSGPPAKVSVVGLTQIVFALAFDVVLWGRTVNLVTLIGMAMVIAPTAWLLTRSNKPSSRPPRTRPRPPTARGGRRRGAFTRYRRGCSGMTATTPEPLLTPDTLRSLEQLEVVSRRLLAGRMKGDRLSRRKGRGSEFADFRPYAVGDDLRFLDWNLYARLERLFVRLFLEEEDLHVHLLIDVSRSMDFGAPTKLLYAKRVAAALGFVGLVNLDRVAVTAFADRAVSHSPPLRGRPSLPRLLNYIDGLAAAGGGDFNRALRTISVKLAGRGVVVVLSDFLDKGGVADGLRYLSARNLDVCAIQVLADEEANPPLTGDLKLTDAEDADEAEVTVAAPLLARYRRTLAAFQAGLNAECVRRGMLFLPTTNRVPFEKLVLNVMRARGVLR